MPEREQPNRWRCLTTGCNPVLDEATADAHNAETGHRVAKWPRRSKAGKKKAAQRNRNGYYNTYNTGRKAVENVPAINVGGGRTRRVVEFRDYSEDTTYGVPYSEAHPEEWG